MFQKAKLLLKRIPKILREYFFLLVMSAQNNHKRFQRKGVAHIPPVLEIKEYQKDLRKKTFKTFVTTMAAILLIITIPIIFKNRFAHSKTYAWVQTSWVGGISSSLATTLTGWTNYWQVVPAAGTGSGLVTANASGVKLTNVPATTVTETGGTYSGSLANGSGMYAVGNIIKLKKPLGASCGSAGDNIGNGECASNYCSGGTCQLSPDGTACTANSQCLHNNCYSNVCRTAVAGVCGNTTNYYDACATGTVSGYAQTSSTFCFYGNYSIPYYNHSGNWTCLGLYGGSPAQCSGTSNCVYNN